MLAMDLSITLAWSTPCRQAGQWETRRSL